MSETPTPPPPQGFHLEPAPGNRWSRFRLLTRVIAVGFVLALLGLLIADLVRSTDGGRLVKQIDKGNKPAAPSFSLAVLWTHDETWPVGLRRSLDDGRLSLAELRGYPIVLNFWASWCVPCKEEAPAFAAAAKKFKGRVAFVGMDTQDLSSAARRFLTRYKVNYVSVRDGTDKTYTAYGLTGVPETYFIDRRGRIVGHKIGQASKADLTTGINTLLTEAS
jgi:cytochrome c biogenesis protein CcmG/thiol:disulfide interchange protein DsbE